MNPSGKLRRQLYLALLNAFPTRQQLAKMVTFGLDANLNAISGGDQADCWFELIEWSITRGALDRLLQAALDENPDNPTLQAAVAPLRSGASPGPASPAPPATPPTADPDTELRELLDLLTTTHTTFVAQTRVRNKLVDRVCKRLGVGERTEYEEFFARYHSSMDEEERRLHATIRAYTSQVFRQLNQRALDLVHAHPEWIKKVPRLAALKNHLIVWLAKYNGVFESSPSMALLYVGVDERVPFPRGIEAEIEQLLTGAPPVVPQTPKPERREGAEAFDEASPSTWSFAAYEAERRSKVLALAALVERARRRIGSAAEGAAPGGSAPADWRTTGLAERDPLLELRQYEQDYAELLGNAMPPGLVSAEAADLTLRHLAQALARLESARAAAWPEELVRAFEAAKTALAADGSWSRLRAAMPTLAVLKYYDARLALGAGVGAVLDEACAEARRSLHLELNAPVRPDTHATDE